MNSVYLDNAATTPTPPVVLDAMQEYYTEYRSNIHRGFYEEAIQADEAYEASKASVARLIGAKKEEIIYTSGATDSLNRLARMLEPEVTNEHNIVLTEMEHHANIIPWQQLAKRTGCELRFIPVTDEYRLDYNVAKRLIDTKTKIVSFVHASNTLGTVNDVSLLSHLTKKAGAYSIIDACQSIAHVPIDVRAICCDFLVASGHKMYGPTGIGVLYGKQQHLDRIDPVVFGGDMIRSVTFEDATWAEGSSKHEAGTPPIAEAIGLGVACTWLREHRKDVTDLVQYTMDSLTSLGAHIVGPENKKDRIGVISFTIGDAHPHDVADILAKNTICVRAGHHCAMPLMKKLGLPGTVRVSIGMMNTKEDIDALIKVLSKAKEILRLSS